MNERKETRMTSHSSSSSANQSPIPQTFANQVVLVTGGSTGIGAATAAHFARSGARVIITGRTEATLTAAAAQHPNISYVVADAARAEDSARLLAEVSARHGHLDVLVNNAGVIEIVPLAHSSAAHVSRTFDTNVLGLIEVTRLALPLLTSSKGVIVNVASTQADQPMATTSVYAASKAAVLALTRAWAKELGPLGIRVNAVSPGPIDTPINSPEKLGLTPEQLDGMKSAVVSLVPLARFGHPSEAAAVIAFLASPAASFVNGAQYHVGGGLEAR
jgi:NAD(P)-dependent dehydrogenase (short-subunit alcohol dehydrogenase family)